MSPNNALATPNSEKEETSAADVSPKLKKRKYADWEKVYCIHPDCQFCGYQEWDGSCNIPEDQKEYAD